MPYENIDGVEVGRWPHNADEPDISIEDADLEELYYESHSGCLILTAVGPDDELWSIEVPVRATNKWNGFVDSLPRWDNG